MVESVVIRRRFRGPPGSGNGGYTCGLVANALGGSDCEVTLHAPPPLERELRLEAGMDEARLTDGATLIASAKRLEVVLEPPPPPSLEEAREAGRHFTGLSRHNFPGCFVCGPERAAGDGLRIFAGASHGQVVAAWEPDPDLFDSAGSLKNEFVWAALDCPGYFAVEERAGVAVLGRLAAKIVEPAIAPQDFIVTGWAIASEGRKHQVGTALYDSRGRLLAMAKGSWITLNPAPS